MGWWPFGPEADFVEHLGMYVATAKLGIRMERDDVVIMLAHPGIAVCVPRNRGPLLRLRQQDPHVILVTRACDITG